ncbi:MAG TPA: isoprenylcysteine carboxylmethyltransferase family protein [Acidimicrobiales bacterium]|nr:isoprenylcysteine carboxylmethyltransferase family protein [Acidimicrobiales bacterium]
MIPLGAGATVITAAIASHYDAAPEEAPITVVPTYLATGGIYGLTRNPLYLGGALMQAGWAILLGSVQVAVVGVVYVVAIDRFGIPFEERMLHDRFGEAYDEYRITVPRWIGRPRYRHTRHPPVAVRVNEP